MTQVTIEQKLEKAKEEHQFSGAYFTKLGEHTIKGQGGYANQSEKIENQLNTRFGIASGCKIFTSVAICQLVEQGKLALDTRLSDCLDLNFPHFDEQITIHHLLTHTSGVLDYFDEDEMDDFEELWVKTPMYHIRNLEDFLPLFQYEKMKLPVGQEFHYNNTGYILLGLVVEKISGQSFTEYVEQSIFQQGGMSDSGYFEMDQLPERVALGYIEKPDGGYRTNIYSLPAKGGADGGAFVTVEDMVTFWESLFDYKLLDEEMTKKLLYPHVQVNDDIYYGYGVWMQTKDQGVNKYILMGYDPGVNFRSVFYPEESTTIVVASNKSDGAYEILKAIEEFV